MGCLLFNHECCAVCCPLVSIPNISGDVGSADCRCVLQLLYHMGTLGQVLLAESVAQLQLPGYAVHKANMACRVLHRYGASGHDVSSAPRGAGPSIPYWVQLGVTLMMSIHQSC